MSGRFNFHVVAGRKKRERVYAYMDRLADAHLGGDSLIVKSGAKSKRPLYKFEAVMFNTKPLHTDEGRS